MSYTDDLTEEEIARRKKKRRQAKRNLLLQHMLGEAAGDAAGGNAILTEASEYLLTEGGDYLIQDNSAYTITLSASSVSEDAAVPTTIGTLAVTRAGTWTFAEHADPDNKFAVSGSNLNTATTLDYETSTTHAVTVRATDSGTGEIIGKTFTITVLDKPNEFQAESELYFAAAAVAPDATRKAAIDALVVSLKAAGVWTKLDYMYLFAAHESQLSLVNLVNPGTFNATVAAATVTFTTDRGHAGDGSTGYITTNFNPATAGGQYSRDSAHMGIWSRTTTQGDFQFYGHYNNAGSGPGAFGTLYNNNGKAYYTLNSNITGTTDYVVTNAQGYFSASRTSSSDYTIYKNGTALGTNSMASTAVLSLAFYICCQNRDGVATGPFSPHQFAAAHAGSGLTSTEMSNLYTALNTYLVAVGAA